MVANLVLAPQLALGKMPSMHLYKKFNITYCLSMQTMVSNTHMVDTLLEFVKKKKHDKVNWYVSTYSDAKNEVCKTILYDVFTYSENVVICVGTYTTKCWFQASRNDC